MMAHGSHLIDTARHLAGEIEAVDARLVECSGAYSWFIHVDFSNGSQGHLDLTLPVRGDFEEGFRIYGENGSVNGKSFLPWFHKSGEVECFSAKDEIYRRPLGSDAYTYKLQIEGFAETVLHNVPMYGASAEDGLAVLRTMVAVSRSVETGKPVYTRDAKGSV